jgi:phosphoserine aminotransferase
MEQRCHNFSAGPAGLPLAVLEEVQRDLLCYPGAGASVMEISHRSKTFDAIHASAKDNIRQLLNLPENYRVLFIQGGATLQFSMLAMNLLGKDQSADYIQCGAWAKKAMGEAKKVGKIRVAWNGEGERYVRMPQQEELDLDPNAAYLHMTSNETIEGVECFVEPDSGNVPLVCDASSNFLSRPVDIGKYGLLYAGAQKNVGPAGVAVVIIREDLLERTPAGLPSLLDYRVMAENDSLYNTPPTFAIYMISLTTKWLLNEMGGLEGIAEFNRNKAQLIYDVIDGSGGFYVGHAQKQNRSLMNVTFVLSNSELESKFVKEATAQGLQELKGHRSVGGCRASLYNAMTMEGARALADFMKEFQRQNG